MSAGPSLRDPAGKPDGRPARATAGTPAGESSRCSSDGADPRPVRRGAHDPADPVRRPVGLETEFGILEPGSPAANPVVMSSRVVAAYAGLSRRGLRAADGSAAPAVRWDYEGEDPLTDLRGSRLERGLAHPSQLTDDPDRPAPAGPESAAPGEQPPAPWGNRPRPTALEAALPRAASTVLSNGGRFYVDHAHPEYASPEVLSPMDALVWDRAGELLAQRAMDALDALEAPERAAAGARDGGVVLYKNNVDGKGAAYGSHESYLLRRDPPFADLARALIPFLVTRPVVAGAGRVGLGQRSQRAGFQISQRADYIETDVGLQTTFNRPVVNTRDEPHADAGRYRRLHVINGDANRFDVPVLLKVASTSLVLWYLEREHDAGRGRAALEEVALTGDVVAQQWTLSHDTSLSYELSTAAGPCTALEVQRRVLRAVSQALTEDYGGTGPRQVGGATAQALALWSQVLQELEDYRRAVGTEAEAAARSVAARDVEWLAKLELCEALRARNGADWDDPRLAALDIQWSDLRAGRGLAERVMAAGRTRRLVGEAQVEAAVLSPPTGTRAYIRGRAVAELAEVVGASWTSLLLDLPGRASLVRLALPEGVFCETRTGEGILEGLRGAIGPGRAQDGDCSHEHQ